MAGDAASPGYWERGFVVAVLFLSTNALLPLLRLENSYESVVGLGTGDPVVQRTWLVVYGVTGVLVLRHHRLIRVALGGNATLWGLVCLAIVSAGWSVAPALTMRRSVALLGTTAFGLYLAARYSRREVLTLLLTALGISAVLSLAFALVIPSWGVFNGWRGVYLHKNSLGRAMAFGVTLWLPLTIFNRRSSVVIPLFLSLSVGLLFLSNSKSSWAVCVAVVAWLPVLRLLRLHAGVVGAVLMGIGIVVPVGSVWLAGNAEAVFALFGRDATLTGRTEVWWLSWQWITERPWLGYGYSAFWQGDTGPSGRLIAALGEVFSSAHQGVLDLWLDLGLAGVVLFANSFLLNARRAYASLRREPGMDGTFPALFLIFLLMSNLTESNILTQNSVLWIMYVVVSVQLATMSVPDNDTQGQVSARFSWQDRHGFRSADPPRRGGPIHVNPQIVPVRRRQRSPGRGGTLARQSSFSRAVVDACALDRVDLTRRFSE